MSHCKPNPDFRPSTISSTNNVRKCCKYTILWSVTHYVPVLNIRHFSPNIFPHYSDIFLPQKSRRDFCGCEGYGDIMMFRCTSRSLINKIQKFPRDSFMIWWRWYPPALFNDHSYCELHTELWSDSQSVVVARIFEHFMRYHPTSKKSMWCQLTYPYPLIHIYLSISLFHKLISSSSICHPSLCTVSISIYNLYLLYPCHLIIFSNIYSWSLSTLYISSFHPSLSTLFILTHLSSITYIST